MPAGFAVRVEERHAGKRRQSGAPARLAFAPIGEPRFQFLRVEQRPRRGAFDDGIGLEVVKHRRQFVDAAFQKVEHGAASPMWQRRDAELRNERMDFLQSRRVIRDEPIGRVVIELQFIRALCARSERAQ